MSVGAGTPQVPAVVLGGTGAAISIVRSLGRVGVPVHVLATERSSLAEASRYCVSFFAVGQEEGASARWLDWLERDGPRGAVLLPTSDEGVELVVRHGNRLRELGYRLLDYAGDTSLAMLDKQRTYALARAIGVECPQTWSVRDEEHLRAIAGEVRYPCGLKPVASHLFAKHFLAKVLIANNAEELLAGFAVASAVGVEMLVTEIIPGPDDQNWAFRTYIDATGQPLFRVTTNRLRSRPIHFGTNTYLVTRWDPEVAEVGLRFLQGIGLRGLAYTELKRDARDGRLKLIECNHRFGNAQEVVRRAGVDVAVLVYHLALGQPQPAVGPWRAGVRLWFPLRDIRAARAYRRAGETTWPRWVGSLIRPRVYLPVFAFDDLRPTFYNFGRRVARMRRRWIRLSTQTWCGWSSGTALAAQEALASLAPMVA